MKIIKIENSNLKNKRFKVILNDGSFYNFGLRTGSTFIDHHDKVKRENYRKRHYNNKIEKYLIDNYTPSPSLFSYYLLWGDSGDIYKNIDSLNKKL